VAVVGYSSTKLILIAHKLLNLFNCKHTIKSTHPTIQLQCQPLLNRGSSSLMFDNEQLHLGVVASVAWPHGRKGFAFYV